MAIYETREYSATCDGTMTLAHMRRDDPRAPDDVLAALLAKYPRCLRSLRGEALTMSAFRRLLRTRGWSVAGRKTYCPDHAHGRTTPRDPDDVTEDEDGNYGT